MSLDTIARALSFLVVIKFSHLCHTYFENWRNTRTHTHTNTHTSIFLNSVKLKQMHHSLINTTRKHFLAKLQSHDNTGERSWHQILWTLSFLLLSNPKSEHNVNVSGLHFSFVCIKLSTHDPSMTAVDIFLPVKLEVSFLDVGRVVLQLDQKF